MALLLVLLAVGCSTGPETFDGAGPSSEQPAWVQSVIPAPGAIATVPNAVEVDHAITSTDEDARLLTDGLDVTT